MNKYIKNTGYFFVGTSVILCASAKVAYTYASAGVETAVKIGKKEMSTKESFNDCSVEDQLRQGFRECSAGDHCPAILGDECSACS